MFQGLSDMTKTVMGLLQNARGFEKSNWPDLADRRYSRDIYTFWGQQPYWESPMAQAAARNRAGISGTPISPEQGHQQARGGMTNEWVIVKGSDFVGHELMEAGQDRGSDGRPRERRAGLCHLQDYPKPGPQQQQLVPSPVQPGERARC